VNTDPGQTCKAVAKYNITVNASIGNNLVHLSLSANNSLEKASCKDKVRLEEADRANKCTFVVKRWCI
jgi:hypothetical protein